MARVAIWLADHIGLVMAMIVCLIAGLCVYAGFYAFAFILTVLGLLAIGAAWDEDTVWEDDNA